MESFFTATCAWGKIPLRLQVWNFEPRAQNYARSSLQVFCRKNPEGFSTVKEADIENVEVLGTITSSVNISQGPEIDDQANRSDWVGASYGTADGRMYLYYDNHWLKCYLPAEIG